MNNCPTAERLREILDYDPMSGIFTWKVHANHNGAHVGDVAGTIRRDGYSQISVDGRICRTAHLAWLYTYDEWPPHQVDHKDQDPSNDRIDNLRLATNAQNNQNKSRLRSDNTSGYLGVTYSRAKNKWQAQITTNGVNKFLGYFTEPELAHRAHLAAKAETHPFWNGEA